MGSREYLERAVSALGATRFTAIESWYDEPAFVRLLAAHVRAAVERVTGRSRVIFTAHSLPERVRAAGDTYPEQLEESARLVAAEAGLADWSVAWQSAGRTPEPWLGPDIRDEVRRLAAEGATDAVVVCPIGFVSDHLEVLYDLDIELAGVAASVGLTYARTASLNDDPAFIDVLVDVVTTADRAA
jgi:ferrochelatase